MNIINFLPAALILFATITSVDSLGDRGFLWMLALSIVVALWGVAQSNHDSIHGGDE